MRPQTIGPIPFTVTGSGQVTLDLPVGYSLGHFKTLRATIEFTAVTPGDGATDTLDVYLQTRLANGAWDDRIHFTQFTGAVAAGTTRTAAIQATGPDFGATESEYNPATRLAAASVKDGPFPGRYVVPNVGPGVGARFSLETTDANTNAVWTGNIYLLGFYDEEA